MGGLSKFYAKSAIWIQNLGISLYGWKWQKRRFGGDFEAHLKAFQSREFRSREQWKKYQLDELRKLLVHAFETVPFYKEKYSAVGLTSADLAQMDWFGFKQLPFLEKDELRKFGTTTMVSEKPESDGEFYASSGSTGTPTEILYSTAFHQRWSAVFESRIRHWAGIDRFHPRGMIGGRRVVSEGDAKGPFYRYNFFEKQTYFSAYHISPDTISDYIEGMRKGKVSYMTGYAMSNYFLAKNIKESGLQAPKLKAVITSSEKLTDEMRELFQEVYGCKTYDSYSGVEACGLFSEDPNGRILDSPDVGITEFLDANGKEVGSGEIGEIVSTGLLNFDQPLIRYRIGDMAELARDQSVVDGRDMPVISQIIGRVEDRVQGPDGREMVRFHGIYINIEGLVASQLIQESIDRFTIRLVVDKSYDLQPSEALMKKRMNSQLGKVGIQFEYVEALPRTSNGKVKAVISRI